MTLLDRLFGPREPTTKAITGPGVLSLMNDVPLESLNRSPQKLMARAQGVYHSNEWVHAAESLISSKFAAVPWHIEDRDGETIDDVPAELDLLLRKPNPNVSRTQLWRLTCRHLGLAGNAFWYLDAVNREGQAAGIYYVNPARMWPALDQKANLQGWILDYDRPNGRQPVPFTLDEIIHFSLDPPDEGYFGIGKVEAAWTKLLLSQHAGTHAAQLLASGGRLAGIMWPKEGVQLSDEQFRSWVSQMRAVTEDPNATKRMNMLKFGVEYVPTVAKPNEIQLPDLNAIAREDLLALWGVPPSQLGVTVARGLNSGETMKYEEAALWQNAIEPRMVPFAETLQERIVTPFGDLTLVLETPEFDDDLPLYLLAEKARYAPLKVDERRALVGLDPLDETQFGNLGQLVYLDKSMVIADGSKPALPIPFGGEEEPEAGTDAEEMPSPGEIDGKARLDATRLRERLEKAYEPKLRRAVSEALGEQQAEITRRIAEHERALTVNPRDTTVWWNEDREHRRLSGAIEPVIRDLVAETGQKLSAAFFPAKASPLVERLIDYVRTQVGIRITGINATTRTKIAELVEAGLRRGDSPASIGDAITSAGFFDEARAEMIARTEAGYALNDASLGTYRELQVSEVDVVDGDMDDVCAQANGSRWTLGEAQGNPLGHPNCTRDFLPVV